MGTINFSSGETKKPEIKYDTNWYNEYCHKCPYFVDDEQNKIRNCVRPFGVSCLVESPLVSNLIVKEKLELIQRLIANQEPIINSDNLPKIHKKIKRRR
jgi:hypothetical protein